jgi:hypothetical protein
VKARREIWKREKYYKKQSANYEWVMDIKRKGHEELDQTDLALRDFVLHPQSARTDHDVLNEAPSHVINPSDNGNASKESATSVLIVAGRKRKKNKAVISLDDYQEKTSEMAKKIKMRGTGKQIRFSKIFKKKPNFPFKFTDSGKGSSTEQNSTKPGRKPFNKIDNEIFSDRLRRLNLETQATVVGKARTNQFRTPGESKAASLGIQKTMETLKSGCATISEALSTEENRQQAVESSPIPPPPTSFFDTQRHIETNTLDKVQSKLGVKQKIRVTTHKQGQFPALSEMRGADDEQSDRWVAFLYDLLLFCLRFN